MRADEFPEQKIATPKLRQSPLWLFVAFALVGVERLARNFQRLCLALVKGITPHH